MILRSLIQFFAALALVLSGIAPAAAQRKAPAKHPSASDASLAHARRKILDARPLLLGYYVGDSRALASTKEYADQITAVAPQSFNLESDGVVRGSVPSQLAALAQSNRLPVMPLVVNPEFDRRALSTILRSPKLQERTASYLAYLARRGNFVGWQLDFERIASVDKRHYSAFVKLLATKLHRDGRLLSVAVTPRFSDDYPDDRDTPYRTGEWGAGFDFRALSAAADFIVLMAYDQHTSATPPGPVAGYDWVRATLDYATSRIPPHKLVLGVPLYGREWVVTPIGQISRSLDFGSLSTILEKPGIEEQWDDAQRSPWLQFREEPDTHTAWYDNRRSFGEKLELVREFGLRGIAVWRLGFEQPEFWRAASDWAEEARSGTGKGGNPAGKARGAQ